MRSLPENFTHTSTERFNSKAIDQLRQDKSENIIPIVAYVRAQHTPYMMGEYLEA